MPTPTLAKLALEDGTIFTGSAFGAIGVANVGEVVFNTSLSGYQEILTDPSYRGQIVTMTYPQIGNYGIAGEDAESRGPQVAGFIIRDQSPVASNWRADSTLRDYLVRHGIFSGHVFRQQFGRCLDHPERISYLVRQARR